jgi:hypothetical protein
VLRNARQLLASTVSGYGKKKDKQEKTVKMTIFAKRKIL